jgi:hypothetical protein
MCLSSASRQKTSSELIEGLRKILIAPRVFFDIFRTFYNRENYQKTPNKIRNHILTPTKTRDYKLASSFTN